MVDRGRQAVEEKRMVATPRVLKPNEELLWRFYLKSGADALLVRSAGLMRILKTSGKWRGPFRS